MSGAKARIWTDAELAYLTHHFPITCNDEIASRIGISSRSVQTKAKSLGLRKAYVKDSNYLAVKALIGCSPVEVMDIVRQCGLPESSVRSVISRLHHEGNILRVSSNKYALPHDDFVRNWLCRAWRK